MRDTIPRRLFPLITLMTLASLGCSKWGDDPPTGPKRAAAPERMEFAADSNPAACAQWACRSMTDGEKDELYWTIDYFRNAAMQNGDIDCYNLMESESSRLIANKIYVGTKAPDYQPDAIGGWNANTPNESYVLESRFIAGPGAAFNTATHETEHNRRGPRPAGTDQAVWEGSIQDTANRCQSYSAH